MVVIAVDDPPVCPPPTHPTNKMLSIDDPHARQQQFTDRMVWSPLSSDLEHGHHPVILVIQNVAMEHPHPGVVVEPHDESRRFVLRNVDRILPSPACHRHAVSVEELEPKSVQMERMVHADDVLDLPDLRRAEPR
ncbi:MAG: hypothetical protein ABIP93_10040, partial [Gemmatimonadaceae bacterium]